MRQFLAFILFVFSPVLLVAQYENITIKTGEGVNEPSIFINPKNFQNIVAGSNLDFVFTSNDGGNTWSQEHLTSTYGVYGDPCILADTAGNFYYFHLAIPVSGEWLDRMVCQKSTDGGQTWNNGSYAGLNPPKDQDKEWTAVDPVTNEIYMSWTEFDLYGSTNPPDSSRILFSKSSDGGATWSPAMRINRVAGNCLDMDSTVEGAVPAPGPDGQVYIAWAGPAGLVFNRSLDRGVTWMDTNIFISDIGGGWDYPIPGIYRANGLPVTCCDLSGSATRGNVYVNWTDQRNGPEDTDVWFKKSTDGGLTWGPLIRVNDDPPGKQQFFSWMTVDQVTGYIYIVFYDRREYLDNSTDVWMAVSRDGGESFTNEKISESPFDPISLIFFGDYTNISAMNGIVRPIWTRLDGTVLSIVTAIIGTPTGTGHKEDPMVSATLYQNYPNPGKDLTNIAFKLPSSQNVTLKVTDIYGKEIATIIDDQKLQKGKHYNSFDIKSHQLKPGMYLFHLTTEGQTMIRKMIVE